MQTSRTKRTFSSNVLNSDGISRNFWISRPVYRVCGYHSREFLRVVSLFPTSSTKREKKNRNGTHKALSDYLKSKSFSFTLFRKEIKMRRGIKKKNLRKKFDSVCTLARIFKRNVRPFKIF